MPSIFAGSWRRSVGRSCNDAMRLSGMAIIVACSAVAINVSAVEEPQGYRLTDYKDTVPETLSGASRVTAVQVKQLQAEEDVLLVDVIPQQRKPDDLPEGQLWLPVEHKGVAGAMWLPDVGYGVLSETTESYFINTLSAASSDNPDQPVVFYCRSDCWMSWNAAKRALSFGYTRVYWFADGIDGWQAEGFDIEALSPAPGQRH